MLLRYIFRGFFYLCGFHEVHEVVEPLSKFKKRYWKYVKSFVLLRSIIMYWIEITQVNLCKEGGKGRIEDFNMFHEEKIFELPHEKKYT